MFHVCSAGDEQNSFRPADVPGIPAVLGEPDTHVEENET